jgi:hypothetical protein
MRMLGHAYITIIIIIIIIITTLWRIVYLSSVQRRKAVS